LESNGRYGTTIAIAAKTISTYTPLDAVMVDLAYTNTADLFHARVNGSFQQKHLLFDFNHRHTGPDLMPLKGELKIRTPLQQLATMDVEYIAAIEDDQLLASGSVIRNDQDTIQIKANGLIHSGGQHALNMTVNHSFGNREAIHLMSLFEQNGLTLNHTMMMQSGAYKLDSSLKAKTFDGLSFRYRMKTIGPSRLKLEIRFNSKDKTLKAEVKMGSLQVAALHFEHSFSSSHLFKTILKGNILTQKKIELEIIKNAEMFLSKGELVVENKMLFLVQLKHALAKRSEIEEEIIQANLLTPFKSLPVLDFQWLIERMNSSAKTSIDFSYEGINTKIIKLNQHEEDGSIHYLFNTTSDIEIIRNILVSLKKENSDVFKLDFELNDKKLNSTLSVGSKIESEINAGLSVQGPWGTTQFNGMYNAVDGGRSFQVEMVDSEGNKTKVEGKYKGSGQQYKWVVTASSPVSQPVELTAEVELGPTHRLLLVARGKDAGDAYIDITAQGSIANNIAQGGLNMEIQLSKLKFKTDISTATSF
jgi:hypothetical protein